MKTIIRFVFTLLLFLPLCLSAQQTGVVKGRVFDSKNNEPIPFANVVIWKTTTGTAADENGYFRIENVPLGFKMCIRDRQKPVQRYHLQNRRSSHKKGHFKH